VEILGREIAQPVKFKADQGGMNDKSGRHQAISHPVADLFLGEEKDNISGGAEQIQ